MGVWLIVKMHTVWFQKRPYAFGWLSGGEKRVNKGEAEGRSKKKAAEIKSCIDYDFLWADTVLFAWATNMW